MSQRICCQLHQLCTVGIDFAERSEEQHNIKWILRSLVERCSKIEDGDLVKPTIVILLTSKNRFGDRIDVDLIHRELTERFRGVFTLVEACQDGQAFTDVDVIVHTKRFTTTGALGLVNRTILAKNTLLSKKLTSSTSFPISILASCTSMCILSMTILCMELTNWSVRLGVIIVIVQ